MAAPSAPAVASDAASRVATDKRINAGAQMTTMRSGALRVTMLRQPYGGRGCRYLGQPRVPQGQPNSFAGAAFDSFYLPDSLPPFVNSQRKFMSPALQPSRLVPGNESITSDDIPQALRGGFG